MLGIAAIALLVIGGSAMLGSQSDAEKIRDEHLTKMNHYWHL